MHEIMSDELNILTGSITKNKKYKSLKNRFMYFLVDGNDVEKFFCTAINTVRKKGKRKVIYYSDCESITNEKGNQTYKDTALTDFRGFSPKCAHVRSYDLIGEKKFGNGAIIFSIVNCCDKKYEDPEARRLYLERLEKIMQALVTEKPSSHTLSITAIIPSPIIENSPATSLAERELDCCFENKELNAGEILYTEIAKLCRTYTRDYGKKIKLLRMCNVFGPGVECFDFFSINDCIDSAIESGEINITAEENDHKYSCTYIRHALAAILVCTMKGKMGNEYNASSYELSISDIKANVHKQMKFNTQLNMVSIKRESYVYHTLCSLKLEKLGYKHNLKAPEALYRTITYRLDEPYDMTRVLKVYAGRLEIIKNKEKAALEIIDRICKENNIQYFLAGGTLLGAVRHGDMIPWDDDLDVGMLRDDFEKFRKAAPDALGESFFYSSPDVEKDNHYFFDKLRLKDTYFSTAYSGKFKINDGIFLDIVVYDSTANSTFMQHMHIRFVNQFRRFINLKWRNEVPKAFPHRKFFLRAMPFLRRISWPTLHKLYNYITSFYNKPKYRYLIDGGTHITKGAFDKGILEEIQYIDFDGKQYPAPVRYDEYLTYLYGKNYMKLLPVSKRFSGHKFARLDFAQHTFDKPMKSRKLNLDGELFEDEIE